MLDKNKVRLGIAPIAWTNDDLPDLGRENTFEQCVSEMALAGFTGSEVGNKYPKDTEVLKKALELRNIEICNQWFSSFLLTKSFEEVEKELDFTPEEEAEIKLEMELIEATIQARKNANLTQRELSKKSGVIQPSIAKIESFKRSPQVDTLIKLLYPMGYTLCIVPLKK